MLPDAAGAGREVPEPERRRVEGVHGSRRLPEQPDDGDASGRDISHRTENGATPPLRFLRDREARKARLRLAAKGRPEDRLRVSGSVTPFADRAPQCTFSTGNRALWCTFLKTRGKVHPHARFTRESRETRYPKPPKIVHCGAHRTEHIEKRPARPSMAAQWERTRKDALLENFNRQRPIKSHHRRVAH